MKSFLLKDTFLGASHFVQRGMDALMPPCCIACPQWASWGAFCDACFCSFSFLPILPYAHEEPRAFFLYEGALRTAIQKAKFHPSERHARILARHLEQYLPYSFLFSQLQQENWECICAIPTPWRTRISRGFDWGALLAQALARTLCIPHHTLLRATRPTPTMNLPKKDRLLAVKNKFALLVQPLPYKRIVLLDDVFTTGATLQEAAWMLEKAGAHVLPVAIAKRAVGKDGELAE